LCDLSLFFEANSKHQALESSHATVLRLSRIGNLQSKRHFGAGSGQIRASSAQGGENERLSLERSARARPGVLIVLASVSLRMG
jgi:hypothetical protein